MRGKNLTEEEEQTLRRRNTMKIEEKNKEKVEKNS